jgi:iron complex transport system ATP-binding protein
MSLQADRITVTRRGKHLIRGVSVALRPGELLAIAGPNGAGKTTLLSALAGDLAPSAGTVRLDDAPLPSWTPLALAQRRAVMPQASKLAFPLPVRAVVALGRMPFRDRGTTASDAAMVEQALQDADIQHLAGRSYGTLSGGEQQRVQLARAIAQLDFSGAPPVLLLDEPTASLDLAHAHAVLHLARRLTARGAAVAAVLHDLGLAYRYSDRVLVLHGGHAEALDTPQTVLNPELLRRVFAVDAQVYDGCLVIRGPAAAAA